MPFTPIHVGPGAAFKAVMPERFSFTVFCFAQVATDCETAYYMIQAELPFHRFCHTYVGATLVGIGSVLVGRPVCEWALRLWAKWPGAPFKRDFPSTTTIPLGSAIPGAFLGTYSYIVLDSIMHSDIRPLMPFSLENPICEIIGPNVLNIVCIGLGVLGAIGVAYRNRGKA